MLKKGKISNSKNCSYWIYSVNSTKEVKWWRSDLSGKDIFGNHHPHIRIYCIQKIAQLLCEMAQIYLIKQNLFYAIRHTHIQQGQENMNHTFGSFSSEICQ